MLTLRKADTKDIPIIRALTFAIWPQTYGHILTKGQLDYMLEMMYSPASLEQQMLKQQHNFIIAYEDEQPVGFASYSTKDNNTTAYKLHKIYVLTSMQGKGTGKKILDYIIHAIQPAGAQTLELNVNRYNPAKKFYEKMGFTVLKTEDIDIGNGYFMNDYVMGKKL